MKAGRPKKINPTGKRFLDLYLDPLVHTNEIAKMCQISRKTHYRYLTELSIPVTRVAVGIYSVLPIQRAMTAFSNESELYDVEILRSIGAIAGIRFKLIPTLPELAIEMVRGGKVNMAIAALSQTKERAHELLTSFPYKPHVRPRGKIFSIANSANLLFSKKLRPTLGVTNRSVHQEFARSALSNEYEICDYKTALELFNAMKSGAVNHCLILPENSIYYANAPILTEVSKMYYFDSHTAIFTHVESPDLARLINITIEKMHDHNLFANILERVRRLRASCLRQAPLALPF